MTISNVARVALTGLVLVGGLTAAGGPTLTALGRIEQGQWQIKAIGADTPPRTACLTDMNVLIQYGHGNGQCQRSIVTNDYNTTTVHYVCAGAGHGQTSIKVATPRAFNLDTQGILSGAPFDESYEARRTGTCGAGAGH